MIERRQLERGAVAAAAISLAVFLLHLAGDLRYGFFRDELYFIACGKHLAWGYVDQPPLVAVVSLLGAPFGYALLPVRLLPSLAAALTAWFAARVARELGGGAFAQGFAALSVGLVPLYLIFGSLLTTTSWEPLSWTILIYLVLRLAKGGDPRLWLLAGADLAFGLYGKYTIALLAAALVAGLLLSDQRRALLTPWFAAGAALMLALAGPNFWWQAAHGFPFLDVIHADAVRRHPLLNGVQVEFTGMGVNAAAFIGEQLLLMHPFLAPVWIAGLWILGRRGSRAFPIAYVLLVLFSIAALAKGYYIMGIYAALISAGSVSAERVLQRTWQRVAVCAAVGLPIVALLPLMLPLLPIGSFIDYTAALRLKPPPGDRVVLVDPEYADEFGWNETARTVAGVYNALPASQRETTAVFADLYPYAAGIDMYRERYGLPPVISPHNAFYTWGTRGYDGHQMIAVGATDYPLLVKYFRSVRQVATFDDPMRHVLEGPLPIYLVRDPVQPLDKLWPLLRNYGP